MNRLVNRRNALFLVPNWLTTFSHLRFRKAVKQLDQIVYNIINQRRTSEENQGTFLDLLTQVAGYQVEIHHNGSDYLAPKRGAAQTVELSARGAQHERSLNAYNKVAVTLPATAPQA
ncbi:hypothetical protein [Brasilonema bromeliae]|uniref:Uncharacterized protein n=1 Tax=Brasilonema bromeliae SPC951 TaxID=385972 RepID=A0ABX1P5K1_9CYAN|nr:hypothetical protein [Brasilonema bromeliae]NMG19645.1 hypothetical protein [Brasilonema bromeliae SPC951]